MFFNLAAVDLMTELESGDKSIEIIIFYAATLLRCVPNFPAIHKSIRLRAHFFNSSLKLVSAYTDYPKSVNESRMFDRINLFIGNLVKRKTLGEQSVGTVLTVTTYDQMQVEKYYSLTVWKTEAVSGNEAAKE